MQIVSAAKPSRVITGTSAVLLLLVVSMSSTPISSSAVQVNSAVVSHIVLASWNNSTNFSGGSSYWHVVDSKATGCGTAVNITSPGAFNLSSGKVTFAANVSVDDCNNNSRDFALLRAQVGVSNLTFVASANTTGYIELTLFTGPVGQYTGNSSATPAGIYPAVVQGEEGYGFQLQDATSHLATAHVTGHFGRNWKAGPASNGSFTEPRIHTTLVVSDQPHAFNLIQGHTYHLKVFVWTMLFVDGGGLGSQAWAHANYDGVRSSPAFSSIEVLH